MTVTPDVQQDYLKEKVRKYQLVKKAIEAMKQRHEEELKELQRLFTGYEAQITGFMQKIGIRFTKTEYGDPGLYSKKSYSVYDQDAYRTHVITNEDWDLLVWAIRRTAADSYNAVHGNYPPGVNVTSEQKLRVGAPTPLSKRRKTPEKEDEDFNAFE